MALLVVLEQLTPAERAAFVLHDVFQFSFETVSTIVGRSPSACRQLASRARRHVEANVEPTRFAVEPELHRRAVERFVAACATGDMEALLAVLDEHVDGVADIGPMPAVFRGNAASGAAEVAARALVIFGPRSRDRSRGPHGQR